MSDFLKAPSMIDTVYTEDARSISLKSTNTAYKIGSESALWSDLSEKATAKIEHELSFEPLLCLEEGACLLRVHPKTLERWVRTGLTPAYRLGRWKFRASELDRWLKGSISSKAASRVHVGR